MTSPTNEQTNDSRWQNTSLPTMTVHAETCTGCRMCVLMCSLTKTGDFSASRARVTVAKRKCEIGKDESFASPVSNGVKDVPLICHQCPDAPCMGACPDNAISRDSATSAVLVDHQACSLCLICLDSCPYEAISVQEDRIAICDLCGGKPVCVKYCSYGTLQYPLPDESSEDEDDDLD